MAELSPDWSMFTQNWSFATTTSSREIISVDPLSPSPSVSSFRPVELASSSPSVVSSTQATTVSSADPPVMMEQIPKPPSFGFRPSPISSKPGLELSTSAKALGMSLSNPATMITMDQTPKPLSSSLRLASPATSSSFDGQDESNSGITARLEGCSTPQKRKREDELHNEGTSPPSKKVARPTINGTNHTSLNIAKNAELISSNVNESYIIGKIGKRTMRNKRNANGNSSADTKKPKLASGSSRKKLGRLRTSPPEKTFKPKNHKSTGSKKRKREETEETDIGIVNNQTQLGRSKKALTSAVNSQNDTLFSSTSGTSTQSPSGAAPDKKRVKLKTSPAHLTRFQAEQEAATENSAAAPHTPSLPHNSTDTKPSSGIVPRRIKIRVKGYETVQEAAREAAQKAATENAEVLPHTQSSSPNNSTEILPFPSAVNKKISKGKKAAQKAATRYDVSQTPPSCSSTAPRMTKTNRTKKMKEKKKRVPCGCAQLQWLGMQSPEDQEKLFRKSDEEEAFFPNDNVVTTKELNGKLVQRCHGDYFVPQKSSTPLLGGKKAGSADFFTYKVYLPSSFTDILAHHTSVPKYFEYKQETISEAGLKKKAKIERMIEEANGGKLMFEFDPSLGENEEIERQFAKKFKFGASAEHDLELKKDIRRLMKLAMKRLVLIRENGLPFVEMRCYTLNFPKPTKKERIVELKQLILQQMEKERNSKTYEDGNERT